MKKMKVLSAAIAGVMSLSCLCMNVSAALDPNDYQSICTDIDNAEILKKIDEETRSDINKFSGYYHVEVDMSAITFSELYYAYDFYNVEQIENRYWQIIFEDDEIIGISCANIVSNDVYVQVVFGDYEYIAEGLENGAHILFGSAVVEGFPCGLFCIDGTIFTDAVEVLGDSETDLVFGEIPYSKVLGGMADEDDDPVVTVTTTEPVVNDYAVGDVNMDGRTSLLDVIYINRITAGIIQANEYQKKLADCCADGVVDSLDSSALLKYLVDLVGTLPVIPD